MFYFLDMIEANYMLEAIMMQESFWLQASDGTEIHAMSWNKDLPNAKAVIQISHGMVEHIGRYDAFAKALNKLGYIIYGHDHRAHGKTGEKQGQLGYISDTGSLNIVAEDLHLVHQHIKSEHPDLPIYIFGHSMGSFITRIFLQKYSNLPAGAILSGTGFFPKLTTTVGMNLAGLLPRRQQSHLMNDIVFGSYNSKIINRRTNFDWLTRDEDIVNAYIEDPFAGYVPTAGFFADLLTGLLDMQDESNNRDIRKDLPLLFLSGDADPVGNHGKGVFHAAKIYANLGLENIAVSLFSEARHELHNETNKDEVIELLDQWLREQRK